MLESSALNQGIKLQWLECMCTLAPIPVCLTLFAVHHCTCFMHYPRKSHEEVVKWIMQYYMVWNSRDWSCIWQRSCRLIVTLMWTLMWTLLAFWWHKDVQDLISVKLRAGYVLNFAGCPLLWVSKIPHKLWYPTQKQNVSLYHRAYLIYCWHHNCYKKLYNIWVWLQERLQHIEWCVKTARVLLH